MSQRTPYTNFHNLNLDWVIKKIKTVFSPDNPPPYPVISVNEMQGAVKVTAQNIPYVQGQPEMIWDEVNKRYIKPQTGIPGSDLAETYLETPATPGTLGQVLTSDGQGNQSWQTPSAGGSVTDVQINGTTIVNNGVANIPYGNQNVYGVVMPESAYGIGVSTGNGKLYLVSATSANIKSGNVDFRPIMPNKEHEATFYGLAKASGDTTQASSNNAVGTYTEEAKVAIRKMLNPNYRLIKEITISDADTSYVLIETDTNGNPFSLYDVIIDFNLTVASGSSIGLIIPNVSNAPSNASDLPCLTVTYLFHATNAQQRVARMHIDGGRFFGECEADRFQNFYSLMNTQRNRNATGLYECEPISKLRIYSINAHKFGNGSVIKVYGR